jgi:carboxypeptidase Q
VQPLPTTAARHLTPRRLALGLVLCATAALAMPGAEEPVDLAMVTRIRDEGLNRSKVMDTLGYLTDVIGPRVTGSPAARAANEWTRRQLESWGLQGAHLERWGPFGRGWTFERASVHMVRPATLPLIALPKAWTPGTDGPVRGEVVKWKAESEADLEKAKGKLAGKVVLLDDAREIKDPDQPLFSRYSDAELSRLAQYGQGDDNRRPGRPRDRESALRRARFEKALREFLAAEKVLATVEPSAREGTVVRVQGGGSREPGESAGVTALVMAAEQYNRLVRLVDRGTPVELEVDVRARFLDDDPMADNTVAEIPGSDRRGEVVMLGAHLDSWHAGTGATDNAAGCAVVMEALRILQALEVRPRRTIRIALWTGEEQGLLGARAYVREHFGSRPEPTDPIERGLPSSLRRPTGPLTLRPDHARLSAYFNLDNGTGRIRGIYTQQNVAAVPIFEAWLRPFADLGATTVSNRTTGSTDHVPFDAVGLPGFQFIQDEADYTTRTHHTNLDVYDRAQREDLMQASVVMASFVYHAAMREDRFPRKPLPRDPSPPPSPTETH